MPSICPPDRLRLVTVAAGYARRRLTVYAGIAANCVAHSIEAARPTTRPAPTRWWRGCRPTTPSARTSSMTTTACCSSEVAGPLFLYNIPITNSHVAAAGHRRRAQPAPQRAGIKNSENDLARFRALLARLGGREDFSIFCGTGAYFGQALAEGADGYVPTAGNLLPGLCQRLYEHTLAGVHGAAADCERQLREVAGLYGRDRLLGQTYGVIKAMLGVWNICGPDVLRPLATQTLDQQASVRAQFEAWLEANPGAHVPAPALYRAATGSGGRGCAGRRPGGRCTARPAWPGRGSRTCP